MAKELQSQLCKATLMLRFRTTLPSNKSLKYVTYRVIASTLNLTENEVQHICRKSLKSERILSLKQKAHKLDQQHFDFLLHPRILEQWAGLTMKKRTVMFHRQFTDKRIAVTSLRRLYLKNGIKRKKVRQEKHMPEHVRVDYTQRCQNLLNEIDQVKSEGRKFVYLDEINFTKRSIMLREWSGKNSNLAID